MKNLKLLILLYFSIFSLQICAQTSTGQEQEFDNGIKNNSSQTVSSPVNIVTQGTDGTQGKISWNIIPSETLPFQYTPTNYTTTSQTLGGQIGGIDIRLGQIGQTTAGQTQRIYWTGDNVTVNAVDYFSSSATGKGSTPSASPTSLVNGDNQKQYFTKDIISIAQPANTLSDPGTYAGQLSVMKNAPGDKERFTVEVYKTTNLGVPIASGITGAPVGDKGVTVIAILDSGEITLSADALTNISVSGVLPEQLNLNAGERILYHVSAAKVGTAGGNVAYTVYYGSNHSSYYDVPVTTRASGVINDSNDTPGLTTADALDYLNSNKEDASKKSDSYTTSSSITYASTKALVDGLMIDPNSFTGTDTEKIQQAVDLSSATGRPVKIAHNDSTGLDLWMIDEAILLNSNTIIYIVESKLKLTDTSRDNVFRTINCGFGITNPQDNPLENIHIIGIGDAVIEGADNPRSTGDGLKTLSLTPVVGGSLSYGTDAGTAEKQTGDWRNIGIIMAYTSNILVKNIKLNRMHCWAFSFERCSKGKIYDIDFNCPEKVIINGNETYIKNTDGIDLLHGVKEFDVQNITGHTGDDMVAMTIIGGTTYGAGTYNSLVTGNVYAGASDEIRNIEVKNVSGYSYANWVRVLNVDGTKISNINISNITDTSIAANLYRNMDGAGVLFGSNNVIYGGATPLGDCARVTVDNVKIVNAPYGVNVQGSLAESTISNLKKYLQPSGVHIVPIFFHPSSLGARNLLTNNIYDNHTGITDLTVIRSGATGLKNGLIKDASGNYAFYEAGVLGNLKSKDATDYDDLSTFGQLRKYSVSTLTDLNSYRESGMFLTPNSGLTNLPSGWAQVRYPIIVVGGALVSYGMQLIVNTSTGELAYRAANNTGTFTSWTTSVPYKVYTAILNQTGTADPVATVLENTTGATVVWTRASVGQYLGTFSSGVLTLNKTIVSPVQALPPYTNHADTYRPDSSTVRIITTSSAANTDGLLSSMYSYVEIKVYN